MVKKDTVYSYKITNVIFDTKKDLAKKRWMSSVFWGLKMNDFLYIN
jgi:hypothetical protein